MDGMTQLEHLGLLDLFRTPIPYIESMRTRPSTANYRWDLEIDSQHLLLLFTAWMDAEGVDLLLLGDRAKEFVAACLLCTQIDRIAHGKSIEEAVGVPYGDRYEWFFTALDES